jgi:probable phosphoglycerate mutase
LKTKTIYLLRHGQTDFNKQGMVQGRGVNAPLNETGKAQAARAVKYFSDKQIERVFCSSLVRTHETIADLGLPITKLDGFDEISWGAHEGIVADDPMRTLYWDTIHAWRDGHVHLSIGGGESPVQVLERQKEAMRHVLAAEEENILICMHGRAIRILLTWLLNYPLKYMDGFEHHNCSIYELKLSGSVFRLEKYNYTGHLQVGE